jgi:hypothetical protein
MRRLILPLLIAAMASPLAAQAISKPDPIETYKRRVVTVYGNDSCPVSTDPEEVVVCARRPEEERFRLRDLGQPDPDDRLPPPAQADRTGGVNDRETAGLPGSCTNIGPGGATGCMPKIDKDVSLIRSIRRAVEGGDRVADKVPDVKAIPE